MDDLKWKTLLKWDDLGGFTPIFGNSPPREGPTHLPNLSQPRPWSYLINTTDLCRAGWTFRSRHDLWLRALSRGSACQKQPSKQTGDRDLYLYSTYIHFTVTFSEEFGAMTLFFCLPFSTCKETIIQCTLSEAGKQQQQLGMLAWT